jgi:hypothetical protein
MGVSLTHAVYGLVAGPLPSPPPSPPRVVAAEPAGAPATTSRLLKADCSPDMVAGPAMEHRQRTMLVGA